MMTRLLFAVALVCLVAPAVARAAESDYHHVHLMAPDAKAAAALRPSATLNRILDAV